jgi:serine protease
VRVFGEDGGWAYSSSIVAAAMKCRDAGANIISMSLGGGDGSRMEKRAFETLLNDNNILLVAAAGNDGTNALSFPASYDSVMSVGALDDKRVVADISQRNAQVDISAPGVAVDSAVMMGTGFEASITTAEGASYDATNMEGSEAKDLQAELVDCGIGDTICAGAEGKICLIQRGEIVFAIKVENCLNGGGIGAIVYNHEVGIYSGTLGEDWTVNTTAYGVSDETGSELLGLVGTDTVVTFTGTVTNYGSKDGTSMATPHVSGVAGLVWSYDSTKSAKEIRDILTSTALDLGSEGRDDEYGHGLVQACNAAKALGAEGLSCFEATPQL